MSTRLELFQNDNIFFVKGDRKKYSEKMTNMKGRWNSKVDGWIIPKTHVELVTKFIDAINGGEIELKPKRSRKTKKEMELEKKNKLQTKPEKIADKPEEEPVKKIEQPSEISDSEKSNEISDSEKSNERSERSSRISAPSSDSNSISSSSKGQSSSQKQESSSLLISSDDSNKKRYHREKSELSESVSDKKTKKFLKNTEKIIEYYKQFAKTQSNVNYSSSDDDDCYSSSDDGFPSPSRKQKQDLSVKIDEMQERLIKIENFIMKSGKR